MTKLLRGYGIIITTYIKGDKDSIEEVNKLIINKNKKIADDIMLKESNKGNMCKRLGYIDYVTYIVDVPGNDSYRKDVMIN